MSDQFNGSADELGAPTGPHKMSDDEVRYITDREINDSYNWTFGKIAEERTKALQYYMGLPEGDLSAPSIPGRSSIVSTDVSDTVEWMLPALIEIFTAGDDVVEFTPRRESDEDGARQTTDVVNHVFYQMNPGWFVLYTWFKDTLLQKNGIVKAWWDNTPERAREEYEHLTDAQFAMLMQDPTVEPVEHSAYPDPLAMQAALQQFQQAQQQYPQALQQFEQARQQFPMAQQQFAQQQAQYAQSQQQAQQSGQPFNMQPPQQPQPPQPPQEPQQPDPSTLPQLHDVAVVRTTASGKVCIDNVPPEEFLISRQSKRIGDGACGHRVKRTVSYLRQKGYKNVDEITSDNFSNPTLNQEAITRRSLEDAPYGSQDSDGDGDETMREVWLTEWYTQMDCDGDGIAEWRKIVRSGNAILENEECDGPCFVSLCAVPLPHLFFGMSPAEQAQTTQRLKTTVWRGLIDNMQMQINGRTWAIPDQVNLDDLLTNRPGGVVRVKSGNAVGALQQGMSDTAGAYQLLEYADTAKQERTGVMKLTQGSDADILNATAAGNERMTDRSNQRIKLIARIFAETGVKDLFTLIQKLLSQYQDRAMTIKLNGGWVDVDPRAWKNQYNMTVNVGLGTGDKTTQVQHLMAMGQAQQQALSIGAATPENIYNSLKKLPPLLGFKNADEFFTDPAKQPPQPPKPDPEIQKAQIKAEADTQTAQVRSQADIAKIQAQHASDMEELAQKERLDTVRASNEAALEMRKQELIDARERDQFARQMEWEREKFYASLAQKREAAELTAGVNAQQGNAQYNADLANGPNGGA